ncbi:MAG: NAD-dependent epimerase/dehydratase family protein [Candidatus Aminicenantaceae bacterium]
MQLKALVTGASGFIGSHLVETLVERNWKVTCFVRKESRTDFLKNLPLTIFVGHAENSESLKRAVDKQDYIFHLAGRIMSASRKTYELANYLLTKNLLEACLIKNSGLKRFVFVSSVSAAGPSLPGYYSDESQPCAPNSEYGRTKLKAEEEVKKYWHSIPATIIRPPNVYGPRQQQTELLIKLIRKRIVLSLKERGESTSLIYVKDLVEALIQAALSPTTRNQVYYVTDGKGHSWRDIIFTLKKYILGNSLYLPFPEYLISLLAWFLDLLKRARIIKLPFGQKAWRAMVKTPWLFSSLKAEKDFGFRSRYALDDGIRATVNYYNS